MNTAPSFYSCDQCPKTFPKKSGLTGHTKNVHSGIKYTCSLCPKTYGSNAALYAHNKKVHEPKLEGSQKPEDKLPAKDELPLENSNCEQTVQPNKVPEKLPAVLEKEEELDVKIERKKNITNQSTKIPEKVQLLPPAIKAIENENISGAQKVSKDFMNPSQQLISKVKKEVKSSQKDEETTSTTDEKPYKCSVCELSYTQKHSLKEHSEIHDNIKYKCKICDKNTVRKRDMHKHLKKKHGKEFPYKDFYDIDKEEKSLEKDIFNKVDQKLKKPEIKKRNEDKSDINNIIQKPNEIIDLKDTVQMKAIEKDCNLSLPKEKVVNYVQASCFASDCQSNHEDSLAKQFSQPSETVQIESDLETQESCVWFAVKDNILEDEETDLTENKETHEVPVQIENSVDTKVLNEAFLKSNSSEMPNLNQYPGISISKADADHEEKIDIPHTDVEFTCETTGCKKKFTSQADWEEHVKAPVSLEGQIVTMLKCILCFTNFDNENCLKYHKEQNCGNDEDDSEFDSEEEEDDFDEDQEEAEGEDDFDDDQEQEVKSHLNMKEINDPKLPKKKVEHQLPELDQEKMDYQEKVKRYQEKLEDDTNRDKEEKNEKIKTAKPPKVLPKHEAVQPTQIPPKSLLKTNITLEQNQTVKIQKQDSNTNSTKNAPLTAPKEKPLSLVQKQRLYRLEQQAKTMGLPYTVEAIIRMSPANFSNQSLGFSRPQKFLCNMIRKEGFRLPSKPTQENILQQRQNISNPKQMLKRKGEPVDSELLTKKIHLESKTSKNKQEQKEVEDPKTKLLKLQQSVLQGLDLGKNKENYEIIIEDGKVKLKIISADKEKPTDNLNLDNKDISQDDPKWKNYTDCKKDGSFSNGGPTVEEGWKMCFVEQDLDGRKVMVAKYMSPDGKFYNRGQNGYEVPELIKQ